MVRNKTSVMAEQGKQEAFITREFDAPRHLVFKAFTDPKLYVQWLGPRRLKMRLEKFEPKSGGAWRYVHVDADGTEYGFHGVNHEVLPPERLPEKGHVSLDTARFEDLPGGRTRLIIHDVFQTVADRDAMMQSGMEQGINESFERLDELLAKTPVPALV